MAVKVKKTDSREEKKPKRKRRSGGVILFLLLLVIILAALLFFGEGLGLGFGTGTGLGTNGSSTEDDGSAAAMATVSGTETEVPEETGPVTIEISGDTVIFGGEAFADYAAFEERFYAESSEGVQYILKDNQAIKSVYDTVKTLLDSFGASYSEETVQQ